MSYQRKPDGVFYDVSRGRLMEHNKHSKRIFWSKDMLDLIRREYPTTLNEDLAGMLGVSQRTMSRKAKKLGLKKDKEWLHKIWDERRLIAHVRAKQLGHPGCFKPGNTIGIEHRFKPKQLCASD